MADTRPPDLKTDAHRMIDTLPDNATWDDIMYRIYVRQCIESGIRDADSDNVKPVDDVRQQFGLSP